MAAQDVHLSPAEAAKKLGVTAKALKLYERHGLVTPVRAANGYRTYGAVEIARLHQVLALKRLGLPLARIAGLIGGKRASLDAILALQETVLGREALRVGHALSLIRAARVRLAKGERLSVDDLANLTTETTMTTKVNPGELETIFKPLVDKHFSDTEKAEIATRSGDHAKAPELWQALMAEAAELMAIGDAASPAALDLARRWKAMVDGFTGGDPAIASKVKAVWSDAFADPAKAAKLPASPEMFGFIHKALENWKASQENR